MYLKKIKTILTIACFLFVNLSFLSAQLYEGEEETMEMELLGDIINPSVSVSSGSSETILETSSNVVVVDQNMIKKFNILTVQEALDLVSGVSVLRTYLKKGLVTSRGILQDHYANKTLIMINNVPSFHGGTGESNINRVDINDVERIEVLKGPASVTYGSNAFSGAVNIVLKKSSDEYSGAVHAGFGDAGTIVGGGHYVYSPTEDSTYFISANFYEEDGIEYDFLDEQGNFGVIDEYDNFSNFNLFLEYGSHSFLVNGLVSDESVFGVTPNFASGAGKNHEVDAYLASYTFDKEISEGSNFKLNCYYDYNERSLPRSSDGNTRAEVVGNRLGLSADYKNAVSDFFNVSFGADYENRTSDKYRNVNVVTGEVLAENNMKDQEVYEYSGYARAAFIFGSLKTDLGVRITENELSGNNTSTNASFIYALSDTSAIKLIAGQSFRSPSLFELYFQTPTNTVFGSTDLDPEESDSIELVYQFMGESLFFQTTLYSASYDKTISRSTQDFVMADGTVIPSVSVYSNGEEYDAEGVEVDFKYFNPEFIDLFVNADFINGDDEEDASGHYNFKYVPETSVSAGISKVFGAVNASLVVNYCSDAEGPVSDIDDFTTVDLNLGLSHENDSAVFQHYISLKNLSDEETFVGEYVRRRTVNELPLSSGRKILYTVKINF